MIRFRTTGPRDLAERLRLPTAKCLVQGKFLFVQMKMKDNRLILQMTRLLFSTAMNEQKETNVKE